MKHTPGPWIVVSNGRAIDIHGRVTPEGDAPRELTIASNLLERDAKFIVQACNSHEALLKACKDVEILFYGSPTEHETTMYLSRVRKAIAKAEGRE